MGGYLTGDPVCHLLAYPVIELSCPGKELARNFGLVRGEAGQLQR